MPSSPNRRRIEIPTALYERLEARAECSQMTTAALGAVLLAAALDQRQPAQEIGEQLRQLVEAEARQQGELLTIRELIQALAPPAPRQEAMQRETPAQQRAHTFTPQEYRGLSEYRVSQPLPVAGSSGHYRAKERFSEPFLASLPPVVGEYLRLLLLIDLAYSEEMRERYRQQAEALRRQLEAVFPAAAVEQSDE